MRVGLGLTGSSARFMSFQKMIECLKSAERNGYESVWIAEDYFYRDAVSTIAALAMGARKINYATAVINPYSRDPALLAMTAANLDYITDKRMILGLGSSLRLRMYEHHLGKVSHVKAMRECIEIIRGLLKGKKVTFRGEVFHIENVQLGIKPIREHIPIYIGAIGPKMLQLAGEIADGVLLTAGATKEYIEFAVRNVEIGAERAGRRDEVDIASFVMISITHAHEAVKEEVKHQIAFLVTLPSMDQVLRLSGLAGRKEVKEIRRYGERGEIYKAAEYVSDDLVNALTVTGTAKNCVRKIEDLEKSGLKLPVLLPLGGEEGILLAISELPKALR